MWHRWLCTLALWAALAGAAWAQGGEARATASGHPFTQPPSFTLSQQGDLNTLRPPEEGTLFAIVDVPGATGADEAVARAWAALRPDPVRPLKLATPRPPRNGWQEQRFYDYETSPNERRTVFAVARRAGTAWVVLLVDADEGTFEKRSAAFSQLANSLRPKGYERERFAGRQPRPIDAAMVARMKDFVADGMRQLGVPGVGFSLIDLRDQRRVVFEGGLGVRTLGRPEPVDAHTLFIAASNTKAMTTALLAQAVDAGRLQWDQPAAQVDPRFRLADPEVTRQVLVKHLVCACTGLPRQDMEWIFEYAGVTPAATFDRLAQMKPTSRFGEAFQYSNLMVAAAGYIAAGALAPGREPGAAYDRAMREQLFLPLGMKDTTFDFARAMAGNHASPHAEDFAGTPRVASMALNRAIIPARPAGGVWTSPHDFSRWVLMELAGGTTPEGRRLVSERNLLARTEPQIPVGEDVHYGMGLFVDQQYGVRIVSHGGDLLGYHSNMIWLPEFGIGATILTNADAGVLLRGPFLRRLLELVFDGRPEAEEQLRVAAANRKAQLAKERETLVLPPDAGAAAKLAARYANPDLGRLAVLRRGSELRFDFGEWSSRVATRRNDDGTLSFVTVDPGYDGFDFVVDDREGRRALVMRDAQHEYRFEAR